MHPRKHRLRVWLRISGHRGSRKAVTMMPMGKRGFILALPHPMGRLDTAGCRVVWTMCLGYHTAVTFLKSLALLWEQWNSLVLQCLLEGGYCPVWYPGGWLAGGRCCPSEAALCPAASGDAGVLVAASGCCPPRWWRRMATRRSLEMLQLLRVVFLVTDLRVGGIDFFWSHHRWEIRTRNP